MRSLEDLQRELSDERDRFSLLEERFLRSLGVSFTDEVISVPTPQVPVGKRHRSWPERKIALERLDAKRTKTTVRTSSMKRK